MNGNFRRNFKLTSIYFIIISFLIIMSHVFTNIAVTQQLQEMKSLDKLILVPKETSTTSSHAGCDRNPALASLDVFFNFGKTHGKASCTHLAELGGNARQYNFVYPYNEGARMVCLDEMQRGNCVTLSFGTGKDYTFDEDMEDVAGCKVYMFDPTVHPKEIKKTPNRKFFRMGLYDRRGIIKIFQVPSAVDRYEGFLQMLNLTIRKIDYLKIDVEGSELNFFHDVLTTSPHLLNNVQQIALEIHPINYKKSEENLTWLEAFQPFYDAMHQLECRGFELISFIPNLSPMCKFKYEDGEAPGCFDVVFFKSNHKNKMIF